MDTDLTTWLLEQIAEDERVIKRVEQGAWWMNDYIDVAGQAWLDCWANERRALAECDAKRRIIALHKVRGHGYGYCRTCTQSNGRDGLSELWIAEDYPCQSLRLLALPYADRPGYREEEWKP